MNTLNKIKLIAKQKGKNLTLEQVKSIYTSYMSLPEKTHTTLLNLIEQA